MLKKKGIMEKTTRLEISQAARKRTVRSLNSTSSQKRLSSAWFFSKSLNKLLPRFPHHFFIYEFTKFRANLGNFVITFVSALFKAQLQQRCVVYRHLNFCTHRRTITGASTVSRQSALSSSVPANKKKRRRF